MYERVNKNVRLNIEEYMLDFEETNVNALFVEPNAYIQNFNRAETKKIDQIIFQQPYEAMPNFHLNRDFKKGSCNFGCHKKENPKPQNNPMPNFNFPFNINGFLPILSNFFMAGGGKSGFDVGNIISMLSSSSSGGNSSSFLSQILQNKELLSSALNLFNGKSNAQKKENPRDIKSTDFPISNYTRVE